MMKCPSNINSNHRKEWIEGSGVHPDIVRLNVRSLEGEEVYEVLLSEALGKMGGWVDQGIVTMPVKRLLDRYEPLTEGGWWVSGLDPLNNWESMSWGQFKPDSPLMDGRTGKRLKYMVPEGEKTKIFVPKLSFLNSFEVANRYDQKTPWISRVTTLAEQILDRLHSWRARGSGGENFEEGVEGDSANLRSGGSGHEIAQICQWLEELYGACRGRRYDEARQILQDLRDFGGVHLEQFTDSSKRGDPGSWWLEDVGFWAWVHEANMPMDTTEGAKKTALLVSQGHIAIGLPGVTGAVRKDDSSGRKRYYLIPEVEYFATPGREINILFDHDQKQKTRRNVNTEIDKLSQQLRIKGSLPFVVSLPGPEKGVDDFFLAHGVEALDSLYADRKTYGEWQIGTYTQLTYPADIVQNQQFLEEFEIPETAQLICIQSPKGSGKTTLLKKVIGKAQENDLRTLGLTHRVQLGQMLGENLGLPFTTDRANAPYDVQLYGTITTLDGCIQESQSQFDPNEKYDIVILDEVEQQASHLVTSTTEIQSRRLAVLENLRTLFTNVLARNGKIILLDADLSDLSIDLIKGMVEQPIEPFVVVNTYKPEEGYTLTSYEHPSGDILYRDTVNAIAEGQTQLILTHSQAIKRGGKGGKHGSLALEASFKALFPDKKFLRIDSNSIANPDHPACGWLVLLVEFNKLLERIGAKPQPKPEDADWERDRLRYEQLFQQLFGYDAIIATPSIGTGVSIDLRGHFDQVVGFFHGVTSPDECRQFLMRLREMVPRKVWINKIGIGDYTGDGSGSLKSNLRTQKRVAKAVVQQLEELTLDVDGATRNNSAMLAWAKIASINDTSKRHYRELVVKGLVKEGQTVRAWMPDDELSWIAAEAAALKIELLRVTAQHYTEEIKAIMAEIDIGQTKAAELKKKRGKTLAEIRQLRRYVIRDRYGDLSEELLHKDDDGWYPKIRLHYFLTVGREFLQSRDYANIQTSIYKESAWLPTLNRSQLSTKIVAMERLGVLELLKEGEIFHDLHPTVQAIASQLRAHPWDCKAILGFTVNRDKDTNIAICQRLLGLVGVKLQWTKERPYLRDAEGEILRDEEERPIRKRTYTFEPIDDGREEVFEKWTIRNEEIRSESVLSTPPKNRSVQEVDNGESGNQPFIPSDPDLPERLEIRSESVLSTPPKNRSVQEVDNGEAA